MQMAIIARPWLAYDVSDSALALGVVAAAQGLTQVLASPFGGLAADRLPKKLLLLVSQVTLLLMATTMAAIVYFDVVEVWHLVALGVVHGIAVPFNHPVRLAYIPLLLPRALLANGMALHNTACNLNQIMGPSIVGILLEVQVFFAFAFIASLHVVATALSLGLPKANPVEAKSRGIGGKLLFGMRYIAKHPMLRVLVLLTMLMTVLGHPYQNLLPVFQKNVLELGPSGLGFMFTSIGLGALLSSLVIASFSELSIKGYPQLLAGILFGGALAVFAISNVYALSLAALFVTGFASQAFGTMNGTKMIFYADPALYGRVSSVQTMTRAFMPMAALPFGALTDAFGAPVTVATGGVLLMVSIFLVGAAQPALWRTEEPRE